MSDSPETLADRMRQINAQAMAQRHKLAASLSTARDALRPVHLKQRATHRLLDTSLDTIGRANSAIRAHPLRVLGIAAMIGAVLARGPLIKLAAQGLTMGRDHAIKAYRNHTAAKPATEDENIDG